MELQPTGSGQIEAVVELPPDGSGAEAIFELQIPVGRPAARSLVYSLCLHAAVITALFTISLPETRPPAKRLEPLSPTELRLDGHLYYVSQIPASQDRREDRKADPSKLTLPRAAAAGKAPVPAPPRPAALPAPPQLNVKTRAPALPSAESQIAATRNEIQKMLARTFVPPEVKRSRTATQTLIQPLSPPDVVPPPTPLPSFRVVSPQFPRIPKPFVNPGRRTPTPPAQVPDVPVPNVELVHADPVPVDVTPKLALPRTPPPPEPTQAKNEGPPPAPAGDAANVLSLSDQPVPANKTIVVPAGNIAQESGDAAASQSGAAAAAGGGAILVAAGSANAPAASARAAASAGTVGGTAASTAGTSPNGASSGSTGRANASPGAEAGASSNAAGTGGSGTTLAGTGRGAVGTGIGSALAGASATGNTTAIVGGTNPNAGTGTGTGTGTGRAAPGQIMTNPPGGNYDAVVIQASPENLYPETRGLLSGRPVYSVYISAGAARDWTLYFCIPNEKPPSTNSPVVQLDPPAAPVRAPYPYKLMRPSVTLPSWEKYVLIHGYVTTDGRFQEMRIVRPILPETDRAILASLADWEFRAATKDGVPVRVEFLLSIPAKGL